MGGREGLQEGPVPVAAALLAPPDHNHDYDNHHREAVPSGTTLVARLGALASGMAQTVREMAAGPAEARLVARCGALAAKLATSTAQRLAAGTREAELVARASALATGLAGTTKGMASRLAKTRLVAGR